MSFGGSPKRVDPPPLPAPVAKVQQESGRKAGEDEVKRLRGRTGFQSAILAGRRMLQPAAVAAPTLKQRLGARA